MHYVSRFSASRTLRCLQLHRARTVSRVCSMNAADADARPGCRTPVGCSFTVRGAIRNSVSLARCSISLPLGNMLGKHDAATITMSCHCDQRVVGVEHIAGRAFATSLIQRKQGF